MPPLRHSIPRQFAGWIARGLGHLLALGGVLQKLFTWIHRSSSLKKVQVNKPTFTAHSLFLRNRIGVGLAAKAKELGLFERRKKW
jgi:hypothetical protein